MEVIFEPMPDDAPTLGFGENFDTVVRQQACGQEVTLSLHRDDDENPPHRHTNDYICIVLSGGFVERHNDNWHDRQAGTFFLHRAGDTHQDRFGPRGAICLSLHMTAEDPLLLGATAPCSTAARRAADALGLALAAVRPDPLVTGSLVAELVDEIRSPATVRDCGGPWIERVVQAISDEPKRRWTLGELAGIAGRHPVHVAQAFRARFGMSLGEFQRHHRLLSLSLALRRNGGSLARLAFDFGYCDQSHMNSEFRTMFGTSPGRYRRSFH